MYEVSKVMLIKHKQINTNTLIKWSVNTGDCAIGVCCNVSIVIVYVVLCMYACMYAYMCNYVVVYAAVLRSVSINRAAS